MVGEQLWSPIQDSLGALLLVGKSSWQRSIRCWIYVPIGIFTILLACFGVDCLIRLSSVSFPASVACLIVLFFVLLICESMLGDKTTKKIVKLLDIPCGFCLRWINVFFCPSFVVLPLNDPLDGTTIGKIAGLFVFGYLIMFTFSAYFVRGLLLLLGTPKRALMERAEELGDQSEDIPLANTQRHISDIVPESPTANTSLNTAADSQEPLLQQPMRTQDPSEIFGTGGPPEVSSISREDYATPIFRQQSAPLTRAQQWAAVLNRNLDIVTYSTLFVLIGLPVYFAISYAMPAHITINVLAYLLATDLPFSWKRFLHPVLVASAATILAIWVLALTHLSSLSSALRAYRTRTRYTNLLRGETHPLPGAGDVLGSAIDVSIVALALPMFQYRHELRRHIIPLLVPNCMFALASLLAYPALGPVLGLPAGVALAFPARSLTLALATPATANVGGDVGLNAVLAIASGMVGVLAGPALLRALRVPEDDYITRGVVLGANSSAIATAMLLATDPRAAAFASLSMGLFGTVMVAGTSVPVIAGAVRSWAGL